MTDERLRNVSSVDRRRLRRKDGAFGIKNLWLLKLRT